MTGITSWNTVSDVLYSIPIDSHSPSRVEALPIEVRVLLMRNLGGISTLFSLLRASPVYLQSYSINRDTIFPDLVCNHIPAKLLPLALTTTRLRNASESLDISVDLDFFRDAMERLESGVVETPRLCAVDAKRLLKFHNLADRLGRDAMGNSLELLRSQLNFTTTRTLVLSLSNTERFRVLRAFYLREFISLICKRHLRRIVSHGPAGGPRAWLECFQRLLSSLPFHQVEELSFVLDYLHHRLRTFFDHAEDDRYDKFVNRGPGHGRYDWEVDATDALFTDDWNHKLHHWLANTLLGESLTRIYELLDAESAAERLEGLSSIEFCTHPAYMARQLEIHRHSYLYVASWIGQSLLNCQPPDRNFHGFSETVSGPSSGLVWAARKVRNNVNTVSTMDRLMSLGIAIWDAKRLRRERLFKQGVWQVALEESTFASVRTRARLSVESRDQLAR